MNETIESILIQKKKTKMQLYNELCYGIVNSSYKNNNETHFKNDNKWVLLAYEILKRSRERRPNICLLINESKYFNCVNKGFGYWLLNNKNTIYEMALICVNKKKYYKLKK